MRRTYTDSRCSLALETAKKMMYVASSAKLERREFKDSLAMDAELELELFE